MSLSASGWGTATGRGACRFNGPVEYETIARIKRSVSIPVFANGEIADRDMALEVLEQTGADGVMIGRASLGAPWLPGQIAGVAAELPLEEKLEVIVEHLVLGHAFYGEPGIRIMRKHVQWYFEKLTELRDAEWRRNWVRAFNGLTSTDAQLAALEGLFPALAA